MKDKAADEFSRIACAIRQYAHRLQCSKEHRADKPLYNELTFEGQQRAIHLYSEPRDDYFLITFARFSKDTVVNSNSPKYWEGKVTTKSHIDIDPTLRDFTSISPGCSPFTKEFWLGDKRAIEKLISKCKTYFDKNFEKIDEFLSNGLVEE